MTEEKNQKGHYHPLTIVLNEISSIFADMGFGVATGPEIETEYYNFDALNIPDSHPARDLWDTFWLRSNQKHLTSDKEHLTDSQRSKVKGQRLLLRTHTSPVQIRYMENNKPPIRIIVPGKTFRYEATDATHEAQFHQVEGLAIDKKTSLRDLKGVLETFFDTFFKQDIDVRFRPSYFPFVEPGVEVDISCFKCRRGASSQDEGVCSLCKDTRWIEVMGAGMVHPKVLKNVNLDPKIYQGFAFGVGVDRLAMLRYGIHDVRLFYNGDLRLVNQF